MLSRVFVATVLLGFLAFPCTTLVSKAVYHKNRRSDTGLFRFEEKGKAGYIDVQGRVVIQPKFDAPTYWSPVEEDFVEGLSPARRGDNFGFIDVVGKWIIEPRYYSVEAFSEGFAAVTVFNKSAGGNYASYWSKSYIDKAGSTVIQLPPDVGEAGPFSEGLAAVRMNGYISRGKLGYIDRSGATVIPFQLADGGPFREGLAAVVFDGQCYIEARNGIERSTPPSVHEATSCGGVPPGIDQRCQEGFIDTTGKVVFRYDGVRDFSEKLAAVEVNGRWGFIDPTGQFRISPQYQEARSFNGGLAAVKSNGKWGYIDKKGAWTIPARFTKAGDFSDGLALTDIGYIDARGKRIALATGGSAFVQGLAHVTLGDHGEFGYMNHQGKIVFRYHWN